MFSIRAGHGNAGSVAPLSVSVSSGGVGGVVVELLFDEVALGESAEAWVTFVASEDAPPDSDLTMTVVAHYFSLGSGFADARR